MDLPTENIDLGETKTAGSILPRAPAKAKHGSSTICAKWSLSPMGLLCTVLALEVCLSRINVTEANENQMSIDEALMEAIESSESSGPLNSPAVIRVQLDMLFPTEEWYAMIGEQDSLNNGKRRKRRKAIRNETLRWPNGQVPYIVDTSFDSSEMQELRRAIEEYNRYTCIRFRLRRQSDDKDFVRIVGAKGCWSFVGRQGGEQPLSLARRCRKKPIMVHELAHAIGFIHEHSRSDRDDYVTIKMENVHPDHRYDYQKLNWTYIDAAAVPYDYRSVMHYGEKAGAQGDKRTIETKNASYQNIIGKSSTFSFNDVKLINLIYRCSEQNKCRRKTCPGAGFVGYDCRCWCPSGNDPTPAVACPGCLDFNQYCHFFKLRGLCNKGLYRDYLLDVCPKSCGSCTSDST